jgi:hypothetical protein
MIRAGGGRIAGFDSIEGPLEKADTSVAFQKQPSILSRSAMTP